MRPTSSDERTTGHRTRTRRRVLAGTGTVLFGGLAGCSGDGDGESGDDGGSGGGDGGGSNGGDGGGSSGGDSGGSNGGDGDGSSGGDEGNDGAGGGGSSGSPSVSLLEHENRGDLFFVDFTAENGGTSETGEATVTVWWLDDDGNRFGEDVHDTAGIPSFPAGDRWTGSVRRLGSSLDVEPTDYEIEIDAEPDPPNPDAPLSVEDSEVDLDEGVITVSLDISRVEEWGSIKNTIDVQAIVYDGEGVIRGAARNGLDNSVETTGLDYWDTDLSLDGHDWLESADDLGGYEVYVVGTTRT